MRLPNLESAGDFGHRKLRFGEIIQELHNRKPKPINRNRLAQNKTQTNMAEV